jgi:beta-lactamase regulating signal transducer with metallopeptidase domain
MDPSLGLLAASGLVSFLLKTTAEWLVCLLLVRIAGSARTRFNLWLTMLLGFVAQWAWMWIVILRAAFPPAVTVRVATQPSSTATGAHIAVATGAAGILAQALVVLLACYLAVLTWRIAGTLAARVRLSRAMRHKSAPQQQVVTSFHEAVEQTGHNVRGCELWVLPGLPSPATLGWLKPRVIVPPVCQTQDAAELEVVFWHELMHVERRDALWNAMIRACRNLLWFHPCVHHAVAALNAQRELACDAAVVREHPHSRDVYASCLLRFARARDLAPEPAVAGIEMASSAALLTTRVQSILNEDPGTSRLSSIWRATVSILLTGAMAATVPALHIFFAAELRNKASLFPASEERADTVKKPSLKSASARLQTAALSRSVAGTDAPGIPPLALQHDEGLAAEHRAAMDVLTESTGMDTPPAGNEGRDSSGLSRPESGHGLANQTSPSWTSVAVDAAERVGPLMSGHDSDDHRYR